ncbi:MAG TPA: hypothetical protein VGK20_03510 [Candidatus Binatia bacterium]
MKSYRSGAIACLASATLLATLAASDALAGTGPPVSCTATFSLLNTPADTGALQYTADYSAAAAEPAGSGSGVSCSSLLPGSLVALNDDEAAHTLRAGNIMLTGITTTPVDLMQCTLTGTGAPKPSDIVVNVVDAATESVDGNESNVCGAPVTGSNPPYSRDALVILKSAVGQPVTCQLCECDPNNSGGITASDSLLALRAAVQQPVALTCPACVDPVETSGVTAAATVGVTLDCTFTCPPVADATCESGTKSSLKISDSADNSKDSMKWKLGGGPAIAQDDLGNPAASTTYTLCVYDSISGGDTLATSIAIAPGSNWTSKDPKGFSYKDKTGSSGGVTKASVKTGAAGKSKISLSAKGLALPLPAPFSGSQFFDMSPRVVVQLHSNSAPNCWSSAFTAATKNTAAKFSAKLP